MAVTPTSINPEVPQHYSALKPTTSPNDLTEIWDSAQLSLRGNANIAITVDAHMDLIPMGTTVEVSNLNQVKDLPDTPRTYWLKSSSAADDKPVLLIYLDENKNYKKGLFILDGTNPVELPPFFRAFEMSNASSQETDDLLIEAGVTGYTLGEILGEVLLYEDGSSGSSSDAKTILGFSRRFADDKLEMQKSASSHFTVPKGYTGYAFGFDTNVGDSEQVIFAIQLRVPGGEWVTGVPFHLFESARTKDVRHRRVDELTDLRVTAVRNTGPAMDRPLSFSYSILLIRNAA